MDPRPQRNPLRTAGTIAAVGLVATLFGLLAWRLVTSTHGNRLAAAVVSGKHPAAPAFRLPLLGGGMLDLAALRGRPVIVNFWASWCTPCKSEAPRLQAAAERYPQLAVVGVNAQDFASDARRFLARYGVHYPNVHDSGGKVPEAYGVTGFPETWFIDRNGRLAYPRIEGEVSNEMLAQAVAALGVR
jgi:cytochrome c biogenesis protein CcmG/thiol:disulfide interchange protein DsbE